LIKVLRSIAVALLLIAAAQPCYASGEIPFGSPVFYWQYNPRFEPEWLLGRGQELYSAAMQGWEPCGIKFVYTGQTDHLPGQRDGINVVGWDPGLAKGKRGITRRLIGQKRGLVHEADVALQPNRKEFLLHPRLLHKVLAHEIGHVMGLVHADNCTDVMSVGVNCREVAAEDLPIMPTEHDLLRCRLLNGKQIFHLQGEGI
jgi:hypothetical protein